MSLRISVDQLEQMKTHEVADLLANIVLVLRRMPDVPCTQLQQSLTQPEAPQSPTEKKRTTRKQKETSPAIEVQSEQDNSHSTFTEEELTKKTAIELQEIVRALHISTSSKRKSDLISKILARQGQEHSEQFAIQNV